MEFVKQGDEVLYVWHGQQVADLELQVNEMKKIANVRVENAEVGLPQGKSRKFFLSACFVYLFVYSHISPMSKMYRTSSQLLTASRHST